MDIKSITGSSPYVYEKNKGNENKVQENKIKDRLEISNEAKIMSAKNVNSSKIEEVKSKIAINFYNSDKVISKVADEILKTINTNKE